MVTVESEYQLTRVKEPPKRLQLSKPPNAVILSESFDISRGPVDANNNNTYIGVYKRVIRLLDNAHGRGFYNTSAYIPGYGNVEFRSWWPASQELHLPVDHRIELIANADAPGQVGRSVLSADGITSPDGTTPVWKLGPQPRVYGEQ